MNLNGDWRLLWKGYRTLRGFWCGLAVMTIGFELLLVMTARLTGNSIPAEVMTIISLLMPTFFALAVPVILFSAEREQRSFDFLRVLPITPRRIMISGVVLGTIGTVLMLVVCAVANYWLLRRWAPVLADDYSLEFGFAILFAGQLLVWGLFFSIVIDRPLGAAVSAGLGACFAFVPLVGIAAGIFELMFHNSNEFLEGVFLTCLTCIWLPFTCLIFIIADRKARCWMKDRKIAQTPIADAHGSMPLLFEQEDYNALTVLDADMQQSHALDSETVNAMRIGVPEPSCATPTAPCITTSRMQTETESPTEQVYESAGDAQSGFELYDADLAFSRLLWQAIREARPVWRWFVPVLGLLVSVSIIRFIAYAVFDDLSFVEVGARTWWLFSAIACSMIAVAGGAFVFQADLRSDSFRFLTHHGVRPGSVWWSRQVVWGLGLAVLGAVVLLIIAVEATILYGLGTFRMGLRNPLGVTQAFATLAFLVMFVGIMIGYACGQFASIFIRNVLTAVALGMTLQAICVGVSMWLYVNRVSLWWTMPLLFGSLMLATRWRIPHLMTEKPGHWRLVCPMLVPVAVILILWCAVLQSQARQAKAAADPIPQVAVGQNQ